MDSLDPLSEWLGLPPGHRPADHYELLGLDRFESDLDLIAHKADTLRARIRKIRPGRYLAEWQRLLDALAAAKLCLSDPISKAAYDESLETSPIGQVAEAPAYHPYNVATDQGVTPLDRAESATGPWDEGWEELPAWTEPTAESGQTATTAKAAEIPSRIEAPPIVGAADQTMGGAEGGLADEVVLKVPRGTGWRSGGTRLAARVLLLTVVLLGVAIGLAVLKQRKTAESLTIQAEQAGGETRLPKPADLTSAAQRPPAGQKGSGPVVAGPQIQEASPGQPAGPSVQSAGRPAPPSSMAAVATASPAKQSGPSAGPVDLARQRVFDQAIADARFALAARNPASAKEKLQLAVSLAATEDEKVEAAGLELLRKHVEAFWGSLRPLVAALKSGSEIEVGDTRVVVVEAGADYVVFRAAGRNRRYETAGLPHRLAAAMARQLFTSSANAKALRAAFVAIEPDGDLNEARQLLREAQQDGMDTSELHAAVERLGVPAR